MKLTNEQLWKIVPTSRPGERLAYLNEFNTLAERYNIVGKEVPAFIAQTAHESGSFHYLKEIASGAAYDTGTKAQQLGNTPQADGDGQRYKGRGYIQITGKANYEAFKKWLGGAPDVVSNPELVARPHLGMLAAIWFWKTKGCVSIVDDFEALTRRINGGLNGYDNRIAIYKRALKTLGYD